MKVNQSFVIDQPREALWEFFEQVDEVARCVPGVESVELIDADNSKVRVTQAVGPMTATFDLKMRITDREEGERIQFTAIGRAVKGAAGNVCTEDLVFMCDEMGIETGIDLEKLMAAACVAEDVVGHPLPGSVKSGGSLKALRERISAAAH